jgi:hypothetical protein
MIKCVFSLIIFVFSFGPVFAGASDEWKQEKSTHFIVCYKNAPEQFIKNLTDRAEEYYNKIADDLGFRRFNFWLWDNRAKIYIHDNKEAYQAATGQPG